MSRNWLVVVFIAFSFSQLQAEPSRVVKYLMNQKATLWDLELFRLQVELDEIAKKLGKEWSGYTRYLWDENRIEVFLLRRTTTGTKSECRSAMQTARKWLNADMPLYASEVMIVPFGSDVKKERRHP